MPHELAPTLAPEGVLRAGINLGNFLLVTDRNEGGDPRGVSPDMAGAIAERLGVPVRYLRYDTPGELADAFPPGPAGNVGRAYEALGRAITEGGSFSPDFAHAESLHHLLDLMEQSSLTGSTVSVP